MFWAVRISAAFLVTRSKPRAIFNIVNPPGSDALAHPIDLMAINCPPTEYHVFPDWRIHNQSGGLHNGRVIANRVSR